MKYKHNLLQAIVSGIAASIPLIIGLLVKNYQISAMGMIGAFSYLAYQKISIMYNLRAITLIGISMLFSFFLGTISGLYPWIAPFIIAILMSSSFLISKILRIPKPNYFFFIMLYASGYNLYANSIGLIINVSLYIVYGIISSIFIGLLISKLNQLPIRTPKNEFSKLNIVDKYYLTLYEDPSIILKTFIFGMILFIAAYIAFLLRTVNGYWVIVSSVSVLSGKELNNIKSRTYGRLFGGLVGVIIGYVVVSLSLSIQVKIIIVILFFIIANYYMPINYFNALFRHIYRQCFGDNVDYNNGICYWINIQ